MDNGSDSSGNNASELVTVEKTITPHKSPLDPNKYRILVLSNGLTVALISRPDDQRARRSINDHVLDHVFENLDSKTGVPVEYDLATSCPSLLQCYHEDPSTTSFKRSCPIREATTSVAICVNVGGQDDPKEAQGLAHFTEHMVHYGSVKFPEEDAVSVILSNFGDSNAYTNINATMYYSQVPDSLLHQSLELVSNMLSHPAFERNLMDREVQAVDNEFFFRLPQWRKSLLLPQVSLRNDDHPLSRMICGSLETLGTKGDDRSSCTATDVVFREMRSNHAAKYVASAMTVALNSTKDLDETQELAVKHFSHLLKGDHKILKDAHPPRIPPPLLVSQRVYLKGLTASRSLTFLWYILPNQAGSKQDRIPAFITRILGDTSEGGLLHGLWKKELIYSFSVGTQFSRHARILEYCLMLTDPPAGKDMASLSETIIQSVLSYLEFLTKVNEEDMSRLFEEMRIERLSSFHFGSKTSSMETSAELAKRLQFTGASQGLLTDRSWRNARFEFDKIRTTLSYLHRAEHMTIIETIPKTEELEKYGKVQNAPYSNAKYVQIPYKPRDIPNLKDNCDDGGGDSMAFTFVPANPYLKDDLKVRNAFLDGEPEDPFDEYKFLIIPDVQQDIPREELSWKSDDDLKSTRAIPKIHGLHVGHSSTSLDRFTAHVHITFNSPLCIQKNTMFETLSQLWTLATEHLLTPIQSQLHKAGYNVSISDTPLGMSLDVHGRSRQIVDVVNSIVTVIFTHAVSPRIFSLSRKELSHRWEVLLNDRNFMTQNILRTTMYQGFNFSADNQGTLKIMSLASLNAYIDGFKRSAFCNIILGGNIPMGAFKKLANHIDSMPFKPVVDNNYALYRNLRQPYRISFYTPGEKCIRVLNLASDSYTTVVTNVYAIGPYTEDKQEADFFNIAMSFMHCEAFMCLRTRQQLGYVVIARKYQPEELPTSLMMFSVTVAATADKFTACDLDKAMDKFLAGYSHNLRNMRDDIFKKQLELTCTPDTVKKEDAADWFQRKFPDSFATRDIRGKCVKLGIKKTTIQLLSGNEAATRVQCKNDCDVCSSIGDDAWVPGSRLNSQLRFATGRGITQDYFVTSARF